MKKQICIVVGVMKDHLDVIVSSSSVSLATLVRGSQKEITCLVSVDCPIGSSRKHAQADPFSFQSEDGVLISSRLSSMNLFRMTRGIELSKPSNYAVKRTIIVL